MSVNASYLAPDGNTFSLRSGTAGSNADSEAEVQALAKLISASGVIKVSESSELATTDYQPGHAATVPFAVGHLNMRRAGTGSEPPFVYRSKPVRYMALTYKLSGNNLIDTTNADVSGAISAYRDGEGLGGYIANAAKPSYFDIEG